MIGYLDGIVAVIDGGNAIVDVNGVGYKVLVATDTLSKVRTGEKVKLFIHTHVREDTLDLYGFFDHLDLKLFQHLISVSGVGPRTAIGVFSAGSRDMIISAIVTGDEHFFSSVPRLGKKSAQKIIIELKDKYDSLGIIATGGAIGKDGSDIIQALKSFGFTGKESQEALRSIAGKGETTEEKIRLALKYLGK
ncbi:MAG: Holliday junction branch migration protein RuvA [Candidatus Levybacteria bacterium]|nr:Holliday junction branch migration protein RuvA [Candidatus Levybacteria bacterium]